MGGHGALTVALGIRPLSLGVGVVSDRRAQPGSGARRRLPVYSGGDGPPGASTTRWPLNRGRSRIGDCWSTSERRQFLETELKPELLQKACADAGIGLQLNLREGYDHSYYFISTFMADHLRWHSERLR